MPETVFTTLDTRGVATLMLNRPDKHNAFNGELIAALQRALLALQQDERVRVVVLTGAGQTFCAGGDLQHMQRMADASDADNFSDALALARCLRTLNELPRPVVARVNGNAFGGGVGLIACADIAIASASASFCFSEVRLGLAAAVIAPYALAALGPRTMRRLLLTATPFDAAQAAALGLLHQVVDAQQLDAQVEREIECLLQGAPQAQRASKQLLRELGGAVDDVQMAKTARVLANLRSGAEAQEGCQAFLERRKPRWAG